MTTSALIVVDAQNDFVDPDGNLAVPGAIKRLETINTVIDAADAAGWTIVYTRDMHPETTPHFATSGGPWPEHCVAGTWGAELHRDVHVVENAVHIHKGTGDEDGYSGFTTVGDDGVRYSTGLHEELQARGIRTIIVLAYATDYCVAATGIDGAELGYDTVFVIDASAAVNLQPGDGDAAVARMVDAGVNVASAAQMLREIGAPTEAAA